MPITRRRRCRSCEELCTEDEMRSDLTVCNDCRLNSEASPLSGFRYMPDAPIIDLEEDDTPEVSTTPLERAVSSELVHGGARRPNLETLVRNVEGVSTPPRNRQREDASYQCPRCHEYTSTSRTWFSCGEVYCLDCSTIVEQENNMSGLVGSSGEPELRRRREELNAARTYRTSIGASALTFLNGDWEVYPDQRAEASPPEALTPPDLYQCPRCVNQVSETETGYIMGEVFCMECSHEISRQTSRLAQSGREELSRRRENTRRSQQPIGRIPESVLNPFQLRPLRDNPIIREEAYISPISLSSSRRRSSPRRSTSMVDGMDIEPPQNYFEGDWLKIWSRSGEHAFWYNVKTLRQIRCKEGQLPDETFREQFL